jgi:hypothetical protein
MSTMHHWWMMVYWEVADVSVLWESADLWLEQLNFFFKGAYPMITLRGGTNSVHSILHEQGPQYI